MSIGMASKGMVEVELTSADISFALQMFGKNNISLQSVQQIDEFCVRFRISREELTKIQVFTEKRGDQLKILGQKGVFWSVCKIGKRPVFLTGMVFLLLLVFYLPTRVLFIQVEGNSSITSGRILEAAQSSGIKFGASRKNVRSEKVKNALLAAVPQLEWAGVNTSGCVARILVRERSMDEDQANAGSVSSIVAGCDGYVLSASATRGTLLCKPGQSVKQGETLISGYTDCGFCIQAERAEGEVFAQTNHKLRVYTPLQHMDKIKKNQIYRKVSVIVGKKRINLWKDSGIYDTSCDRMYKEYYITLPGGFQLPAALCVETFTCWEINPSEIERQLAQNAMSDYCERYLKEHMLAGTILSGHDQFMEDSGVYHLEGDYTCAEMIGRVQLEKIGDTNGKSG